MVCFYKNAIMQSDHEVNINEMKKKKTVSLSPISRQQNILGWNY